jgi:uncharacterized protein (TIGR02246 family)
MRTFRPSRREAVSGAYLVSAAMSLATLNDQNGDRMTASLDTIGADYAAAWSSKSPAAVAAFYAQDGQIVVNNGAPSVGHKAIAEMATGFYTAFPDLVVRCDAMRIAGHHALFAWTLEGHHAQTKNFVRVAGWEEWELDENHKVKSSLGWFDASDYDAQIAGHPKRR